MLNQKLLSIIALVAMTLLPQGAWADSVIFSMTDVTGFSGILGTDYVDDSDANVSSGCIGVTAGKTLDLTATFTGGTAKVKNGHDSKNNLTLNTSTGVVNIGNSSNSYLFITLSSTTIQEGDIITLSGYKDASNSSFYISYTTSKGSVTHSFASSSYTVPAASALIGKASVYFFNSKGTTISSITITRPQPATPEFSPASGEVAQGSKITVTSTYATTIQYKWTANSTTPADGWTAYTDGAVVPEQAAGTPYLHVQCTRDGVTGTTTGYAQYTITGSDTDAPVLESTSPANSATGIAIAGDIVLTFDENVACTTNATLTPEGGEAIELTPVVSGTTVTYSYTGLAYQKAHTFALAANSVEDVSGNKYASAISFSFTTAQEVVADPTFDVKGGYSFTIACATAGATIYYAVDDADPINSVSKKEYTTTGNNRLGIKTSGEHTVYAYAVKAGAVTSAVVSQAITVPTNGDTYITKPLTIKLQPTSAGGDDQYENNTYTNNGFSLSSTKELYNASNVSGFGDASLSFKANGGGTLTVTAPTGVTIQAIKVYAMRNANNNVTTISTTSGHTRKSSSNRIIPRLTYDYDSGVGMMSEHVITKDEPDNTCQFTIADQCRLYVEVYADVELATLDNLGYATFASAYPLDLANMTATTAPKAYKAAVSGTKVNFTEVSEAIAANTGILLEGGANETVTIPVAASGTDISSSNAFKVNTTGGKMASADVTNNYFFAMMKNQATLTFATFDPTNLAIPANKAYLEVAKNYFPNNAQLSFIFGDGDGETTNINLNVNDNLNFDQNAPRYNLSGQRVSDSYKGIVIVNGRKYINK